jgi:phytoene/squalene synthetase
MFNTTLHNSPFVQGGDADLPARITKEGSKQTYYTFRLFADQDRVDDGFRAYAYFRWLDDLLDCDSGSKNEKIELITRQQELLEAGYQGRLPLDVNPEEQMLVDLIRGDKEEHSGLQIYLRNMMAVMASDVERCGRLITHAELTEYTHLLASAVTELLFYLIGHKDPPPRGETRYHAVCGAHIVHMLRDTVEDVSHGYFNIPGEYIENQKISLEELHSLSFRRWVFERTKLAREYFSLGRFYIAQVKNLRCRLAGYAYLARFEWMLRLIERDQYCLKAEYPERKSLKAVAWMAWRVFASALKISWHNLDADRQAILVDSCEER